MPQLNVPLVGAHHHPPAKWVLQVLPAGTKLYLQAEPENPYDENAIAVLVSGESIPESMVGILAGALEGTGFTVEDVAGMEEIMLGYVAKSGGKFCPGDGNAEVKTLARENLIGVAELPCKLGFDISGNPQVVVEV